MYDCSYMYIQINYNWLYISERHAGVSGRSTQYLFHHASVNLEFCEPSLAVANWNVELGWTRCLCPFVLYFISCFLGATYWQCKSQSEGGCLCICAKRWKVPCFDRMQLCLIAYSFAEDCPLFLPVTTRVFPRVASQHFFSQKRYSLRRNEKEHSQVSQVQFFYILPGMLVCLFLRKSHDISVPKARFLWTFCKLSTLSFRTGTQP